MDSTAFPSTVAPMMASGGSPNRRFGALATASAPPQRVKNGQPSAVEAHALALALADFIGRIRTAPGTNQEQLAAGALAMRRGFLAVIGSAAKPPQLAGGAPMQSQAAPAGPLGQASAAG